MYYIHKCMRRLFSGVKIYQPRGPAGPRVFHLVHTGRKDRRGEALWQGVVYYPFRRTDLSGQPFQCVPVPVFFDNIEGEWEVGEIYEGTLDVVRRISCSYWPQLSRHFGSARAMKDAFKLMRSDTGWRLVTTDCGEVISSAQCLGRDLSDVEARVLAMFNDDLEVQGTTTGRVSSSQPHFEEMPR